MSKPPTKSSPYSPDQLKILFEALSIAPSYLSKRFILTEMLGWDEETLKRNMNLVEEENNLRRLGKTGGF
jgi:hypothetical protein